MITAQYLPEAYERHQRDLIESEREQRRTAEKLARELVKVLQELAILLDGDRLESLRRGDPGCPQYWTPEDWRQFFARIPAQMSGSSWGQAGPPRSVESKPPPEPAAVPPVLPAVIPPEGSNDPAAPLFDIPAGMTPPLGGLLTQAQAVWPHLPASCPAAFRSSLSGKGRMGEELKKAYRRSWLSLYLIGTFRLNATLEIDDLLALTGGLSSRAGSLSRIMDELVEAGLLHGEIRRLGAPRTSLRLVTLSPEGRRLFQILFEREPLETDWERLAPSHSDESPQEHTLAVLIFAMHARKRGWATEVLPAAEGQPARPDLLVVRGGERWHVQIETGPGKDPSGEQKGSLCRTGQAALCAATPESRKRLSEACRQAGVPGCSTDLETLIRARYGAINEQTPLWAESW